MNGQATVSYIRELTEAAFSSFNQAFDGLVDSDGLWRPGDSRPSPPGSSIGDMLAVPYGEGLPMTVFEMCAHVGACKLAYMDYAFGPAGRAPADLAYWNSLEYPSPSFPEVRNFLQSTQEEVLSRLSRLTDAELSAHRTLNWGGTWPLEKIFRTLYWHDWHHGAQIRYLRRLMGKPAPDLG